MLNRALLQTATRPSHSPSTLAAMSDSKTTHKIVDMLVHNSDASTVPNLLLSYLYRLLFPSSASASSTPLPSLFSILTLPAPINVGSSLHCIALRSLCRTLR